MKRFILNPPASAGQLYSSLIISPESIAKRASSSEVSEKIIDLTMKLSNDAYTDYTIEFYKKGLAVCGDHWGFMDIVSVLYAIAEMGQPENYLEIGVRRGRSVCAVASVSPYTDIYAFDLWQPGYAGNENPGSDLVKGELAKFDYKGRVQFFNGDSRETIPRFFTAAPDLTFDLITVDGDHSVEGAWDDLRNVVPHLKVGGVLVFDDTANPYCAGLDKVWIDLLRSDRGLRGFSYNKLGTGVSFAIRKEKTDFIDVRIRKFWQFWSRQ